MTLTKIKSVKNNSESEKNDSLLVNIGESRDKVSFKKIYKYFSPRIKGYIMKLGAEESMAEEIVQETMTTIWRKSDTYDPKNAGASTWIFTIARNKRIDRLRKDGKKLSNLIDPSLQPQSEKMPDENLIDKEIKAEFSLILKKISPDQAKIIKAAYYEGKTHKEISDEIKIPLGTVKSRVRLALKHIKDELGGKLNCE